MGFFDKVLGLFRILKVFYWFSLVGIFNSYRKTRSATMTQPYWAKAICDYLRMKLYKLSSKPINEQNTIYLINHRSQGDFFIHSLILRGKSNFLSRRQVAYLFGPITFFVWNIVWFFNRSGVGSNFDKQAIDKTIKTYRFNSWLDKKFQTSPNKGLIVYPQGHRMYDSNKVQPKNFKRGLIKYAYGRKIPCQIIISFGNEKIFNEKKLHVTFDGQVYYRVAEVIDPKNYQNEKEFLQHVQTRFIETFDQTYQDYINKNPNAEIIQKPTSVMLQKQQ